MPGSDETVTVRPMKPSAVQKIRGWFLDYCYLAYWMLRGLFSRSTAEQLLQPQTGFGAPILLIPGVYESWRFMQPVAAHLYRAGHPVYVLDKLGYNTGAVEAMAKIVSECLESLDLGEVIIIAHSKGGLIAKHALANPDTIHRVRHVIAINTPFSGSRYANLFLMPSVRMFMPTGLMITQLALNRAINAHISSLYSVFDPHIPETSHLEGAENIILPAIGHFRPIGDQRTLETIDRILARLG
jgi:pimeloyl-ACP methyl ester carboxylesterase